MAIQTSEVKQRQCLKCGTTGETVELNCPECGRRMQSESEIRVRGLLTLICGGILVAMIGYISLWMMTPVNYGGAAHSRFTGTHEQMLMIAGLLGLVVLFGLISFVAGLGQLVLGRRNRLFVRIVVGLGILLFIAAYGFAWLSGR